MPSAMAGPNDAPPAPDRRGGGVESLVVQTSFLGDVVLTTPLIAELAARGAVDVVATREAAPLLANNPGIRSLIPYDKRRSDAGLSGLVRAAARVRAGFTGGSGDSARIAYVVQRSIRSAALALLAGCRVRVGFSESPGRVLYTHRVPYADDRHHAERVWRLAFPDGDAPAADGERLRPRLYPGAAETAAVDALIGENGGTPLVALAPGSIWGTKRWPYYAELARRLAATHHIVVIGAAADAELAREIAAVAGSGRVIDATGRLSLLASAELVRRVALLVTNDSAPLHLASATGTPTVAIFGPTVPSFGFGPLAARATVAEHDSLTCRPCHHHGPRTCPLGHWRCMRELDPATIHQLALRTLN